MTTLTKKTDAQRKLDRVYAYLVNPMTELRVPSYLRGAARWNGTVAALTVISEAYMECYDRKH